MSKDRKKLLHIHSSVNDKQPTPATLELGELAVNNAEGNAFISTKNSDGKVVRFSEDETIINWMEYKEIFPYSAYVRGSDSSISGVTANDLASNKSNIIIKLNQVSARNSEYDERVNGAKDIYGNLINPISSDGYRDGAGISIDMSQYAMQGANPSFSSVTTTNGAALNGNTEIYGSGLTADVDGISMHSNDAINLDADGDLILNSDNSVKLFGQDSTCVGSNNIAKFGGYASTIVGETCDEDKSSNTTLLGDYVTIDGDTVKVNALGSGDGIEVHSSNKIHTVVDGGGVSSEITGSVTSEIRGEVQTTIEGNYTIDSYLASDVNINAHDGSVKIQGSNSADIGGREYTTVGFVYTASGGEGHLSDNTRILGNDVAISGNDITISASKSSARDGYINLNADNGISVNSKGPIVAQAYGNIEIDTMESGDFAVYGNSIGFESTDNFTAIANGDICFFTPNVAMFGGDTTLIGKTCGLGEGEYNESSNTILYGKKVQVSSDTTVDIEGNGDIIISNYNPGGSSSEILIHSGEDLKLNASNGVAVVDGENIKISAQNELSEGGNIVNIHAHQSSGGTYGMIHIGRDDNSFSPDRENYTVVIDRKPNYSGTPLSSDTVDKAIDEAYYRDRVMLSDSGTSVDSKKVYTLYQNALTPEIVGEIEVPTSIKHLDYKPLTFVCGTFVSGDTSYDPGDRFQSVVKIPASVKHLERALLHVVYGKMTTSGATTFDYDPGDIDYRMPGLNECHGIANNTEIFIPKSIEHLDEYDENTECVNIGHDLCIDGKIVATSGVYSKSDERLKENIKSLGYDDLKNIDGVNFKTFNFKDDETKTKTYGVTAQNVKSAGYPELIHTDKDGIMNVDYTSLLILKIAKLEETVSRLSDEIKFLKEHK